MLAAIHMLDVHEADDVYGNYGNCGNCGNCGNRVKRRRAVMKCRQELEKFYEMINKRF